VPCNDWVKVDIELVKVCSELIVACFMVQLLYVLIKFWCKLPEDGDNAETRRN